MNATAAAVLLLLVDSASTVVYELLFLSAAFAVFRVELRPPSLNPLLRTCKCVSLCVCVVVVYCILPPFSRETLQPLPPPLLSSVALITSNSVSAVWREQGEVGPPLQGGGGGRNASSPFSPCPPSAAVRRNRTEGRERRKEVSHMEPLVPTRGYTHRGERKKENQCFFTHIIRFCFS